MPPCVLDPASCWPCQVLPGLRALAAGKSPAGAWSRDCRSPAMHSERRGGAVCALLLQWALKSRLHSDSQARMVMPELTEPETRRAVLC